MVIGAGERERVGSAGDLGAVAGVGNTMGDHGRCSRCSSLLSMASGGSRYSLVQGGGAFVSVSKETPTTPPGGVVQEESEDKEEKEQQPPITCKLCLTESSDVTRLTGCGCVFCTECMRSYARFEVLAGAYTITCPDAECPARGVQPGTVVQPTSSALTQDEIKTLAGERLLQKHNQYRLNREIDMDRTRTWCPRAGCETVCSVAAPDGTTAAAGAASTAAGSSLGAAAPRRPPVCAVQCPTCSDEFCSSCKKQWHPGQTCEQYALTLGAEEGFPLLLAGPGGSELIKSCPLCSVPIEKDEGCAQMMCKRCKHVFCWYCLTSLDDDFLLRHYDKGPCKNKLGHSRASVIWHRTQVIGIFAGFGILLLVASPLLLLAAPCIVCCKCRVCNGAARLDQEEGEDQDGHDGDDDG
ncbi:probable E3 ubiquitin-protein ligase RNF144A [Ctenocephalides felis]|uniref:probable E3 ubiquitin-protein ligase RNF144A n=1 Tax=Ctenocephalides felis TaxID=7515 RepID=UPI000E6E3C9E|nr:probable E3 ubiquitin-protein ligase RNF144A [Ctenocephalides felis]